MGTYLGPWGSRALVGLVSRHPPEERRVRLQLFRTWTRWLGPLAVSWPSPLYFLAQSTLDSSTGITLGQAVLPSLLVSLGQG